MMSYIVEPAVKEFDLNVVRADKMRKPGMIGKQVAAQCFHDPVQAGFQPSKWRCGSRARRSHPARSESRNSRLLCGECSTAREKVSPQARRCAISRRRFGRRANNFGETPTGTGNMAPNRRESETHHIRPPESLPTVLSSAREGSHTRSPGRSPPPAGTNQALEPPGSGQPRVILAGQ
jgi:hypothetical protein